MGRDEALKLALKAEQLVVSKGTRVVHVDLKNDKPQDDEIVSLMLGPTGNLRAPTLQVGKTLLVGFDEGAYTTVLN